MEDPCITSNLIELPDQGDNIIRTYDLEVRGDLKNLGHELFWAMKKHDDSVAQIDAETNETDTYSFLLTKCIRTAVEMRARGITADDIICLCTTNHINTYVPFFAALFIGAKVASLDPSLSLSDTKHLLKLVAPKLIFASPNALSKLEQSLAETGVGTEIVVFGESSEFVSFKQFLKPSELEKKFEPTEVDVYQTALIFFTSGTTGLSKGICLNHYSLFGQASRHLKLLIAQNMFISSPLYWFSASFSKIMTTLAGGIMITASSFTPENTWKIFKNYKVSNVVLSPSETMQLLEHGRPENLDLPDLKVVAVGGSYISSENLLALRKMFSGAMVMYSYGQTEIAGSAMGFSVNPEEMRTMIRKVSSVGKPLRGVWYKIVDPESQQILGPNQPGELRLKTKFVMNGYHQIDSSSAWDSQGWLKTGDICYYDENHCFYVVDRLKEMIKYRGWQISPVFIESVLEEHPAVKQAVVIGVPHKVDVEHALGLVELMGNAGHVTPEELVNFVSDKIRDDKKALHGGVKFVSKFPSTPSGKINRSLLKIKILAEIGKSTDSKL